MPVHLKRALTIDEIFERVRTYDLVLTVDAPLADALNARIESPLLGVFAITPRRLAYRILDGAEDGSGDQRELFLDIIKKTGTGWKSAIYFLENVISCWQETGDRQNILKYPAFDRNEVQDIVSILGRGTNPFNSIENYNIDPGLKVAVVGFHQFTGLDRRILPPKYDEIPIFHNEDNELEKTCLFSSATAIIQTVMDNLRDLNPLDVAVVVKPEGNYQHLLKSSLKSAGIPYMVSPDIMEDEDVRTFFLCIRTALSRANLRLRDVWPIMGHLGLDGIERNGNQLLDTADNGQAGHIRRLLDSIPGSDFRKVLKEYESFTGNKMSELEKVLGELDILDTPVDIGSVNAVEYYLGSFNITAGASGPGVLIASPDTTTYIDRPVIFYIGMDAAWTHVIPDRPWISRHAFNELKLNNFQVLLQNGQKRYYMVQDQMMGRNVIPCYYFNELADQPVESFTDFEYEMYTGIHERSIKDPFSCNRSEYMAEHEDTISQSELNLLAYCPRDLFFSRLLDDEDNRYLLRGRLLHEFAEFYVDHADFIRSRDLQEFVDLMIGRMSFYLDERDMEIERTRFLIGISNIREFLDPLLEYLGSVDVRGYEKRYSPNLFVSYYKRPLRSSVTEMYFSNPDSGAKGKIDLIFDKETLLDHKTGKKRSINELIRKSDTVDITSRPDFQAKMYLSHHRRIYPDIDIKFRYFHILDNLEDVINSGNASPRPNIKDLFQEIIYYSCSFDDLVVTRDMYDDLTDGIAESNPVVKVLKKIGYENYRNFFALNPVPFVDEQDPDYTEEFISYVKGIIGDYKYINKGCERILGKMADLRRSSYFPEDLDEFDAFLHDQIRKLNQYKQDRFPVGDIEMDNIRYRDLVILW